MSPVYERKPSNTMMRIGLEGGMGSPYILAETPSHELLGGLSRLDSGKFCYWVSSLTEKGKDLIGFLEGGLWLSTYSLYAEADRPRVGNLIYGVSVKFVLEGEFILMRAYYQKNPPEGKSYPVPVSLEGKEPGKGEKITGHIIGELPKVSGLSIIWKDECITLEFPRKDTSPGSKEPLETTTIDVRKRLEEQRAYDHAALQAVKESPLFQPGTSTRSTTPATVPVSVTSDAAINWMDVAAGLIQRGMPVDEQTMNTLRTSTQEQLSRWLPKQEVKEVFAPALMTRFNGLPKAVQEKLVKADKALAETMLRDSASDGLLTLLVNNWK